MTTTINTHLVAATHPNDDRAAWMEARSGRVTASRITGIANGGRSTWQRILADMLNGSTFKGTASTRRGNVREAFLIDYAREFIDQDIDPNGLLFVHPENDRIGATPDGTASTFGVEVKSHDFGWDRDDVPAEHFDQMQLGMYVTGYDRWLYVWEVMGEDGEPTLDDPHYLWVERDERRIAFLVREAQRFLAWWDAGAPATDDIPDELDDALAAWADARARKKDAEIDEKAAEKVIRDHIAATSGAEDDGLKRAGRAAQFVYAVSEKEVLDVDAWAAAEPDTVADFGALKTRVEEAAAAAAALYHKPARSTRLNITATKDAA